MSPLVVILFTLCGLAALEPTEQQTARPGAGRIQERLAVLRQLGLVRH